MLLLSLCFVTVTFFICPLDLPSVLFSPSSPISIPSQNRSLPLFLQLDDALPILCPYPCRCHFPLSSSGLLMVSCLLREIQQPSFYSPSCHVPVFTHYSSLISLSLLSSPYYSISSRPQPIFLLPSPASCLSFHSPVIHLCPIST